MKNLIVSHCIQGNFIRVNMTPEILKLARNYSEANYVNNGNSVLNGNGTLIGYLGELVFESVFYPIAKRDNTFNYDFIMLDKTIDIKTKNCFQPPQESRNECSVQSTQITQGADLYVFVWVEKRKNTRDFHTGWISGFVSKEKYFNKAIYYRQGDVGDNGHVYKYPKYNLDMKHLTPLLKWYNRIYKEI